MLETSVQTRHIIDDNNPLPGFMMIKKAGFDCVDFSLNDYLKNKDIYNNTLNSFFGRSLENLFEYFTPIKEAAKEAGIRIHQMHMPYPNYVPTAIPKVNDFLLNEMAPKSMEICNFLDCKYIVVHGIKSREFVGSEEAEWQQTEDFLHHILPIAKKYGIVICIENLYAGNANHFVEGPCCNAVKAVKRIEKINAQYDAEVLGFCFDTGHANLVGIEFESFLMTLGKHVKVLHIHDNDGVKDLHQMPFTFTRTRDNKPSTDWDGFLRALVFCDYRGTLNFETSPIIDSFPDELKEDALHMLSKIGEYFAGKIKEK